MTNPKDLSVYRDQLKNEFFNDQFVYRQVYKKSYKFYLIGKSTTLLFSTAEELWKMYLKTVMVKPIYDQFIAFLQTKNNKNARVHSDLWNMVFEFATAVKDVSQVSEMDAWPGFLDDFVDFYKG